MKIKTIGTSLKIGSQYVPAGSVVEIADAEARTLIADGLAEDIAKAAAEPVAAKTDDAKKPKVTKKNAVTELRQVKGVNKQIAGALYDAGIGSIDELKLMSIEQLIDISGIGESTAPEILEDAQDFEDG